MKLNNVLLGMLLATAASAVVAKPAPVIDYSQSALGSSSVANSSAVVGSLEEKIALLERQMDSRNQIQVNVQSQLDELKDEVDELRGITEEHSHQLSQVLERQRELYQELDRRVSEALKAPNSSSTPPTVIDTPSVPTYSQDLTENEYYDRALNMVLTEKRYEEAITEFRNFNAKYPNSSYSANSHYWLGQLLYNKSELTEAATAFETVVNKYPKSNKRSDAMLKLAKVEQKRNNIVKAKSIYQKLIAEYPNSNAAKLAVPRLESIGQ